MALLVDRSTTVNIVTPAIRNFCAKDLTVGINSAAIAGIVTISALTSYLLHVPIYQNLHMSATDVLIGTNVPFGNIPTLLIRLIKNTILPSQNRIKAFQLMKAK
jgi:hypothetical protein